MPSLPRSSRSRSLSNRSRRTSYREAAQQTCYRDAAQQTSKSRNSSRRRPVSPHIRRPNRTPSPSPARPSATHPDRKRFGLHVHDNQPRIGKFDFEAKYPEDPIYEELGPNARVWRVNLDECEVFDNDMVVEARDGLDLLLVFAGLFSAVLTTFVAQTSQALSNNFPAVSTSLLLEIVTLHRAFINGTPIDDISSSEMTSGPSGFDVWVNALWFTSLTLSLGTALIAVLVKQWLYQYMSFTSGTARDRSLIRFYRFDGLRKWHVLTIIGTLPIVLHVALALFLAGLVVFLIPLNVPLATIVGFITVVIYTMYTVSNILPIIYTQCPYRTPFSDIFNVMMRPIFTFLSFMSSSAPGKALRSFFTSAIASHLYKIFSTWIFKFSGRLKKTSSHPSTSPKVVFPTLKDTERIAATGDEVAEGIAADALVWLHQMTSNPPTKSIVLQSLGCLSDDVSDRLTAINTELEEALEEMVSGRKSARGTYNYWSILRGRESRAERLLRAQRHIKAPKTERGWWEADAEAFKPPFHILAAILTYAPAESVECRGGEPRDWHSNDLLVHIIQEYSAGRPTHLPSALWQRFMPEIEWILEDTNPKLPLCRLTLDSWDNNERTPPPFSGGVPITHDTVPFNWKHVIPSILPQNDLPGSEPLHGLCIINDCIVSELSTNRNLVTDDAISALLDIWNRIQLPNDGTSGDPAAVCRRAEKCMLEVFVGDWWDGLSDTDVLIRCYSSLVQGYWIYHGFDSVPSVELLTKLFAELCRSSVVAGTSGYDIVPILERAFSLDVESTTAYYTFLCGSESPLFSPQTKLALDVSTYISGIIAAFVGRLARGSHPPALTHQCMEFLCAEPDRLFTLCRICALPWIYLVDDNGVKEKIKSFLVKLVRLDPNRAAWEDRTHYLIDIEPWDWPYFVIPKDHEHIADVKKRMQFALKVLDDFFACPSENHPNLPPAPPPSETTAVVTHSSMDSPLEPPTVVTPWRRVRQLVLTTTVFRSNLRASSLPADIELARPPNDRTSQMIASEPPDHTLAIEPAPPSSSNAAGPQYNYGIDIPGMAPPVIPDTVESIQRDFDRYMRETSGSKPPESLYSHGGYVHKSGMAPPSSHPTGDDMV